MGRKLFCVLSFFRVFKSESRKGNTAPYSFAELTDHVNVGIWIFTRRLVFVIQDNSMNRLLAARQDVVHIKVASTCTQATHILNVVPH